MFTVNMLDDIKGVEPRLNKWLSMRQFYCILVGCIYAVPIALLIPVSVLWKIVITIFLLLPAYFCGNPRLINHEPLEIVLIRTIYKYLLTPTHRKVKSHSTFKESQIEYEKKKENRMMKKLSSAQKKAYLNQKKQKEKLIPSKDPKYKLYH